MNQPFRSRVPIALAAVFTFASSAPVAADEAIIAVAANFTAPMKAIITLFEKETKHSVKASYGSTGKLYAQIKNGAPFEALLAADQERPQLLEQELLAVPGSRFTYATGTLVLWSAEPDLIGDGAEFLKTGNFVKLAIANPKLAPYGVASIETLDTLNVRASIEPKIVMGENIAQTYQFVDSGNAQVGFVALSQVMTNGQITTGSGWIVPAQMHAPIRQDAVILNSGKDNAAITELFGFLKGQEAQQLISDFGYQTEAADQD